MKRWALAILLAIVVAVAAVAVTGPVVQVKKEASNLPREYLNAIEKQATGVYSSRLPLVPLWVEVEYYDGGRVYYTIHYFPFGSMGMSYGEDGYNQEKPLTRV